MCVPEKVGLAASTMVLGECFDQIPFSSMTFRRITAEIVPSTARLVAQLMLFINFLFIGDLNRAGNTATGMHSYGCEFKQANCLIRQ